MSIIFAMKARRFSIYNLLRSKVSGFLLPLLCSSTLVNAQNEVNPMNILFIGNSYTHMNKMPELFGKMATSKGYKVNVEMDAKSNHTFKMHAARPELFEHIKQKKWDYVILQGFSREMSYPPEHLDTATIPYFNKIIDSIYTNNACTNVLLYMTWGYKEGFAEREEVNTYDKMTDSIQRGYQYVSQIYDLPIVPVGYVWKTQRSKSPLELYDKDLQHPSYHGSYLTASTFYAAIFKSSPLNAYYKNMSDVEARELQLTAYDFVINNLDKYKLRQNTLKVKHERTAKGEYLVHCEANYPCAVGVKWDFGDGRISEQAKVSHQYKKAGTYWVILTVEDMCGNRVVKRKVNFEEPKKPTPKKNSKPKVVQGKDKKV